MRGGLSSTRDDQLGEDEVDAVAEHGDDVVPGVCDAGDVGDGGLAEGTTTRWSVARRGGMPLPLPWWRW